MYKLEYHVMTSKLLHVQVFAWRSTIDFLPSSCTSYKI